MKSKKWLILALILTGLWLWFIYARSAQPAAVSHGESMGVLSLLQKLIPGLSHRFVRKAAHFTEYLILGGLLFLDWRLWGRGGPWLPFAAGCAAAAADELLQTRIPGRSGQLTDLLLDASGVLCALAAALLAQRLLRRRKERKRLGSGTD